jgi:hypothetical protein
MSFIHRRRWREGLPRQHVARSSSDRCTGQGGYRAPTRAALGIDLGRRRSPAPLFDQRSSGYAAWRTCRGFPRWVRTRDPAGLPQGGEGPALRRGVRSPRPRHLREGRTPPLLPRSLRVHAPYPRAGRRCGHEPDPDGGLARRRCRGHRGRGLLRADHPQDRRGQFAGRGGLRSHARRREPGARPVGRGHVQGAHGVSAGRVRPRPRVPRRLGSQQSSCGVLRRGVGPGPHRAHGVPAHSPETRGYGHEGRRCSS